MTDAGTFVLSASKHLATDHSAGRTITITALTHKQFHKHFHASTDSFQVSKHKQIIHYHRDHTATGILPAAVVNSIN